MIFVCKTQNDNTGDDQRIKKPRCETETANESVEVIGDKVKKR